MHSYQRGVVLRFGKFHRIVEADFHWIWPFCIETYLEANVVRETMMVGPQSLTTVDGHSVVITTVVTFNIEDIKTFLLDIEGAHQVIEDSTYGIVASFVMKHTWQQLLDVDISKELTKDVRRSAKKYGVAIDNVQVADFTRSRSIRLLQQLLHHGSHGTT